MAFGPTAGTAYVDVLPRTSQFGVRLRNELGSPGTTGIARKAGIALGGALALGIGGALIGVGKLVSSSIGAAIEAEKITRQTEAVIKSTRGVANVTAAEVDKLALSIMGYSGISDEAIANTENLLLTFTNIQDQMGAGNVFEETTKTVVDMSVALDQDLKSSAIQVGKALNDPITGLTSLSRVGVKFTEDTKEQITTLVEQGKTLEAQRIILDELKTEFGGMAKASAEPWDIMRESLGNVLEELGKAFLPMIRRASKAISDFVASKEFQEWMKDAIKWVKEVVQNLQEWVRDVWPEVKRTTLSTLRAIGDFWDDWGSEIITGIKLVAGFLVIHWKQAMFNLKSIIFGIKVIGIFFKNLWDFIKRTTGDLLAALTRGWRNFLVVFFQIGQKILDVAAATFGWIPGIGDRVQKFREDFGDMTTGILNDLERQGNAFDAWGATSRKNVAGVNTEVGKLLTNLKGISAPGTIKAEFVGGDGIGFGAQGGLAATWANLAMAAVPGPQAASGYVNRLTASGNVSYHADVNNPAQDISGANLMGIFQYLRSHFQPHIRELLYTPAGYSIINGMVVPPVAASDHYDHVHVADQGGVFKGPGLLAMGKGYEMFAGGLKPAQRVAEAGGTTVNVYADSFADERKIEKVVLRVMQRASLRSLAMTGRTR